MTVAEAKQKRPSHADVGNSLEIIKFKPVDTIADGQFMVHQQLRKPTKGGDTVYRVSHSQLPLGLMALMLLHEPTDEDGERVDRLIEACIQMHEANDDFELIDLGTTPVRDGQRRYVASHINDRERLFSLDVAAANTVVDISSAPTARAAQAA